MIFSSIYDISQVVHSAFWFLRHLTPSKILFIVDSSLFFSRFFFNFNFHFLDSKKNIFISQIFISVSEFSCHLQPSSAAETRGKREKKQQQNALTNWACLSATTMEKIMASYDFPTIVNNSRTIQLLCVFIQILFIYTESASLSFATFLFYSFLVGIHAFHLARRWYYNIDGRYDVRQIIRDNEMTLRIQYAVAIFLPMVLGLLTYSFINLKNGLVHSLFHFTAVIQILCATIQLGCEFFEVVASSNQSFSTIKK